MFYNIAQQRPSARCATPDQQSRSSNPPSVGLPDQLDEMNHLARVAHDLYPNQLRGGEGHMEVAKVIDAASKTDVHMVISVKPFGCMPSSGISDGVQSLVTARYPNLIFCPQVEDTERQAA